MTYVVCCVQSCNECVHRLGVAQVAEAVLREVESRQGALSDALLLKVHMNHNHAAPGLHEPS